MERFSRLVGAIYDAALDPELWPAVLRDVSKFVGGYSGSIIWKDVSRESADLYHHDSGISPEYIESYLRTYVKLDPSTVGHFFADGEEPVSTTDLLPYDEFTETRFYREWAEPQGLVDSAFAVLDRSSTGVALVGVFRTVEQGLVDEEMRRRMRLIVPHIRRAALIGRVIGQRSTQADLSLVLDGLAAAVFLVDGEGGLVWSNRAGRRMLASGELMKVWGERLSASDEAADGLLRASVRASQEQTAGADPGAAFPIRASGGELYVGHVLPLQDGERRRTLDTRAVAAIFVQKTKGDSAPPAMLLARHYRLTPTELRVLLGVVEVGGVPEVAAALGIAETTVKTHLARLFEKTGAKRQADLVRLIAEFKGPFSPAAVLPAME